MRNLINFTTWRSIRESEERIPKNLPVEMPVPPELDCIINSFKNVKLKVIDHEIKTPKPGTPDKKMVGAKIANMPFNIRNKIKASGNKLYLFGDPVENYLKHFVHITPKFPEEIWNYEGKTWTLCTNAHPEVIKIILKCGIRDHIIPDNVKITEIPDGFSITIKGKRFTIESFKKNVVGIDGKSKKVYTSSMFNDSESRQTIYYGVEDKKIYDFDTFISDIENQKVKTFNS